MKHRTSSPMAYSTSKFVMKCRVSLEELYITLICLPGHRDIIKTIHNLISAFHFEGSEWRHCREFIWKPLFAFSGLWTTCQKTNSISRHHKVYSIFISRWCQRNKPNMYWNCQESFWETLLKTFLVTGFLDYKSEYGRSFIMISAEATKIKKSMKLQNIFSVMALSLVNLL